MTDSARVVPGKFLVAFSFAGEQRQFVQRIAEAVELRLGRNSVFYDNWYEYFIAGEDSDLRLQDIYGDKSELVVLGVSKLYGEKPWTRAEHRAIRARQMRLANSNHKKDDFRILPLRVGDGDVPGIQFNSIVPDVRGRSVENIANMIIRRLCLVRPDLGVCEQLPADSFEVPGANPAVNWFERRSIQLIGVSILTFALLLWIISPFFSGQPLEQFNLESDLAHKVAEELAADDSVKSSQSWVDDSGKFLFVLQNNIEPNANYFRYDYEKLGSIKIEIDVYGKFPEQKYKAEKVNISGKVTEIKRQSRLRATITIENAKFIDLPPQ